MTDKQYLTIKQLSQKYPAFPEGGLRYLVFNADKNNLASAIIRVGRKVLLEESAFLDWINNQNGRA